jgi:catechol 2,3-dioxygenase-like lactoylglutathione lyase family enzyme
MAVLNHHIVRARDNEVTARFFAETLGFEPPTRLGEFAVLQVSKDTTLDFVNVDGDIHQLHYAFLVTEEEFDEIFERLGRRNAAYWSDPFRQDPGRINHWDDGRGVYFDDPNGHLLEIITRPYGSGGLHAKHPHPLLTASAD